MSAVKISAALVIAYFLTGIYYVVRDVRAHVIRQPTYAREFTVRGRISPLILAGFTWLPATIFACTLPGTRFKHLKRQATVWLVFAALSAIGLYFSST